MTAINPAYLATNYTRGRSGHHVRCIVLHITAGADAASCIGWFNNPTSDVSAHYVIDRDGTTFACVDENDTAWANGVMNQPNTAISVVYDWWMGGINPNSETVSIECAGYSSMEPSGQPPELVGYTQAQFDALGELLPAIAARHGLTVDGSTLIGHCDIDGVNRVNCPGLSEDEWRALWALGTPVAYATADEAFDAALATGDYGDPVWSGELRNRAHWTSGAANPVAVLRTSSGHVLAYDPAAAAAIIVTALVDDDWETFMKLTGQLQIYGAET
jgi:N-acetyl-anhydromuramyl-L-alanine amidase AmpD